MQISFTILMFTCVSFPSCLVPIWVASFFPSVPDYLVVCLVPCWLLVTLVGIFDFLEFFLLPACFCLPSSLWSIASNRGWIKDLDSWMLVPLFCLMSPAFPCGLSDWCHENNLYLRYCTWCVWVTVVMWKWTFYSRQWLPRATGKLNEQLITRHFKWSCSSVFQLRLKIL